MYFVSAFGEYVGPFKTANDAAKFIKDGRVDCCPTIKVLIDPANVLEKRRLILDKQKKREAEWAAGVAP